MKVTIEGARWANLNGSRGNHHAHQALMDAWKDRAVLAVIAWARGRQGQAAPFVPSLFATPVQITATVRRTRNGRADAHNVTPSIKACIDALVTCGVIEDDHDGIVRRLVIEAGPKAPKPTIELTVSPITAPPYLADPDPTPTRPAPITVLIRTRYGLEHHKHVDGDTHRAGPTCPCQPHIDWRATMSEIKWTDAEREAIYTALWSAESHHQCADLTGCPHCQEQERRLYAALAPHVAAREAQAAAKALHDAAGELERLIDEQHPAALNPDQWLRDRADQIEQP